MSSEMSDESPFLSMEEVERPLAADREDMWDQLVDMCEGRDADFGAVMAMYEEAAARSAGNG